MRKVFLVLLLIVLGGSSWWSRNPQAQGTLSNQVLALLTRINAWTNTNTFFDLRMNPAAIPSVTAARIYADVSGNLYYNGGLIAGAGGGITPHNLLSTTHPDTLAGSVARASVLVGNATPRWAILQPSVTNSFLAYNGTDVVFSTNGAALIGLSAAQLSGTASAFNGGAITNLNATNLATGTVPLAVLSGITNAQIAAAAAIAYAKLALTGAIVNADVSASAAIVYSKLALTGSIVTGDLVAGTLLFDRWASNGCTTNQYPRYSGTTWGCRTLVAADISGGGTVTSVALSVPGIFSVSGSPLTTSGTIAISLATQAANLIWAGPTTGSAAAPTFRSLVNADLPLTGVGAGTYAKVTINTAGVVTSAATQASLTTDVAGILPYTSGGTGVAVAADDSVLIGSGAGWAAKTIPDCPTGSLAYTQATNLFNCSATAPTHALLSATHSDTAVGTVVRGDLIIGNATPAWAKVTKGTLGQLLIATATDAIWGNAVSGLIASTAGTGTLGSVAAPFASLLLGTAATNNLAVTPAAFAQTTTATVDDPGLASVKLALVRRGTLVYTAGALTAGTCSAAVTVSVTGLATTSTIAVTHNAVPGAQWQKGIYFLAYPTTNTINLIVCNPTAGSITPDTSTLNYTAVVP